MGWIEVMGKVQDEAPAKATKTSGKSSKGGAAIAQFLGNLVRPDRYKPTQGKNARFWTAIGLGLLIGAGLFQLYELQLKGQYGPLAQFGIPALLGLAFAWVSWRVVNYPPFADFLIATEAEMNKVSWTSREDLRRATIVVLATILLLAVYLFAVDYLWSALLQAIGILKFNSESFGSQAG